MVRKSSADVASEAEAALSRALQRVLGDGFEVVHSPGSGPDLTITLPHGPPVVIEVKAVAHRAEPGPVANALRTWNERLVGLRRSTGNSVYGVVVAAAIPEATKAILRENGWGWLDRRGELDLRTSGLIIHATDVESSIDNAVGDRQAKDPIRGRAGITAAACLLLEPGATLGVREIARAGGLAPSSVSAALADLRHASLLRADGGGLIPELFWALADAWQPRRDALAEAPRPGGGARLALGLDDLAAPGWVAGGTLAAAAWSAPVVVASGAPPDFYVPNENEARAGATRTSRRHQPRRTCMHCRRRTNNPRGAASQHADGDGNIVARMADRAPPVCCTRSGAGSRAGRGDTRRLDTPGAVRESLVNTTQIVVAGEAVASMTLASIGASVASAAQPSSMRLETERHGDGIVEDRLPRRGRGRDGHGLHGRPDRSRGCARDACRPSPRGRRALAGRVSVRPATSGVVVLRRRIDRARSAAPSSRAARRRGSRNEPVSRRSSPTTTTSCIAASSARAA